MDESIEEIVKLISNYAAKRKRVDQNFFEQLACIIVDEKELNSYVKRVDIKNRIGTSIAGYNPITGIIRMNLKAIEKEFLHSNIHEYSLLENELLFESYLNACHIFLHECCHAEQFKTFCEDKENIKAKIFTPIYEPFMQLKEVLDSQESFSEKIRQSQKKSGIMSMNDSYYFINPAERMAEIESYKAILEMAKHLLLKKSYFYNEYVLYAIYIGAYIREDIPTLSYLHYMGYNDISEEIKTLAKDMKQKDRLFLGLNISEKKYTKLLRKQSAAWYHFNE